MYTIETSFVLESSESQNVGTPILVNDFIYYFRSTYVFNGYGYYGAHYTSTFEIKRYNLKSKTIQTVRRFSSSGYGLPSFRNRFVSFIYNDFNESIYVIPGRDNQILEIDKYGSIFSRVIPGYTFDSVLKFVTQQLVNNKIYLIPYSPSQTEIIEYDCSERKFRNIPLPSSIKSIGWTGQVVLPDQRIVMTPGQSNQIVIFNSKTETFETIDIHPDRVSSVDKWWGQVLQFNNKIYCPPYNSNTILEIDPYSKKTDYFGNFTGTNKYMNGTITLDTKTIVFSNYNVNSVLVLDTSNVFFVELPISRNSYTGQIQQQNGNIYLISNRDVPTTVLTNNEITKISKSLPSHLFNDFNRYFQIKTVLKKHSVFDQKTYINIRKSIHFTKTSELLNYEKVLLNIDDETNNPHLYDFLIFDFDNSKIYNVDVKILESITELESEPTLNKPLIYFILNEKSLVFNEKFNEDYVLNSSDKNLYFGVFTKGLMLFENVKTLSGLKKFVSNEESDLIDRTKVHELVYVNTEEGYQHTKVNVSVIDLFEELHEEVGIASWEDYGDITPPDYVPPDYTPPDYVPPDVTPPDYTPTTIKSQKTRWFSFRLKTEELTESQLFDENWTSELNLGTVNYNEEIKFFVKCTVDVGTEKGDYYDQMLVVSKYKLEVES